MARYTVQNANKVVHFASRSEVWAWIFAKGWTCARIEDHETGSVTTWDNTQPEAL